MIVNSSLHVFIVMSHAIYRCWQNCEPLALPGEPLVIYSECDNCISHEWFVNGDVVKSCESDFCKIEEILKSSEVENVTIEVIGAYQMLIYQIYVKSLIFVHDLMQIFYFQIIDNNVEMMLKEFHVLVHFS